MPVLTGVRSRKLFDMPIGTIRVKMDRLPELGIGIGFESRFVLRECAGASSQPGLPTRTGQEYEQRADDACEHGVDQTIDRPIPR